MTMLDAALVITNMITAKTLSISAPFRGVGSGVVPCTLIVATRSIIALILDGRIAALGQYDATAYA